MSKEKDIPTLITDYGVMNFNGLNRRCGVFACVSCGEPFLAKFTEVKRGHSKTCGCYIRNAPEGEERPKEGDALYNIYNNMKNRCNNPNATGFKYAGAKGLTICEVCEEWSDFYTFRRWAVMNGYEHQGKYHLKLVRRDNAKGYDPENCYFKETKKEVSDAQD